jgi:threonine dehydratase
LASLKPSCNVYATEVEGADPFNAALKKGQPVKLDMKPSFVDGIGSQEVLHEMWPLTKKLLKGSLVSSVQEVASAVKLLAENNKVVAEGAGACAVAAALKEKGKLGRKVVCVISGGGLDTSALISILSGQTPKSKL